MKKAIAGLFIMGIGMFFGIYTMRNALAAKVVNKRLSEAFTHGASLGGLNLDLFGSSLSLAQVQVQNPEGFSRKNAFEMGLLDVDVEAGSVFTDQVNINSMTLSGVVVQVAFDGRQVNVTEIAPKAEKPKKEFRGKTPDVLFKKVAIKNMKVILLNKDKEKEFKIPDFNLDGLKIGKEPMPPLVYTARQLFKRIGQEALDRVKKQYKDEFKEKLMNRMKDMNVQIVVLTINRLVKA